MEFTGYARLRLWVEAQGSNDMDIFATLAKYDPKTGQKLESLLVDVGRLMEDAGRERNEIRRRHLADPKYCEPYFDSGPMGCLRASRRELDEKLSTLFHPVYTHQTEQLLQPKEVLPLDIAFWPYGMICNQGEELRLTISGVNLKEHLRPNDCRPRLRNRGTHIIHTGSTPVQELMGLPPPNGERKKGGKCGAHLTTGLLCSCIVVGQTAKLFGDQLVHSEGLSLPATTLVGLAKSSPRTFKPFRRFACVCNASNDGGQSLSALLGYVDLSEVPLRAPRPGSKFLSASRFTLRSCKTINKSKTGQLSRRFCSPL
ncbi:hypothetical protein BO83DRAFT_455198 [Aspergillus eucalypticola CBS 122712]|uniref:Xaa-Pro dipeptidyl-peptidase C-terminal domain-containing protein n=1 Tax=Aspergillus eucalypticola (strain CBS 122712 / IBT 29274) TaxID=1448314 RepID=A0A317UQN7_ASPEC|nr:uncharacterized protein BO83DRAFT_455198 [Aspergillus eucalypticola CBS 122712]PWY64314.1 hypothetical protein BO83DRAFT_455198 [Aspergillus eucalypticola CBS 122712]